MSRMKLVMSACLAVLAFSALVSSAASAATAGWMVKGTLLSGTKALATTAAVDKEGILSGASLTIKCTGSTLDGTAPTITSPAMGLVGSLTFLGCKATAPCKLTTTSLSTVPLLTETTLEGTAATVTKFKPESGTIFSTFAVEGETCAAEGNIAVEWHGGSVISDGSD